MHTQSASTRQHLSLLHIYMSILLIFVLTSCQGPSAVEPVQIQAASVGDIPQDTGHLATHENEAAVLDDSHRQELDSTSPIELNPDRGQEIGSLFEAFLSPHQEGGEEEETPALIPAVFKSTAPSMVRNERQSRGHGVLAFTNDLSKALVYITIDGIAIEEIVMFHIHCGRPGQLGPILVDFSLMGDLQQYWSDNVLAVEITNDDLLAVLEHGEGMIGAFTAGCPIIAANPLDKVTTIGGMETIARQGELYFNLHTKGQTFFGDIRGKLQQVELPSP